MSCSVAVNMNFELINTCYRLNQLALCAIIIRNSTWESVYLHKSELICYITLSNSDFKYFLRLSGDDTEAATGWADIGFVSNTSSKSNCRLDSSQEPYICCSLLLFHESQSIWVAEKNPCRFVTLYSNVL